MMNWSAQISADKTVLIRQLEKALTYLPPLASLYSRPYREIVKREIRLAAIRDSDIIVNIGCGAIPFTSIYLAQLTGARVIALDRDRKAVDCARRYVKARGLAQIVRVMWGDGAQASECESAAVWIVALQAAPKQAILEHFFSSAPRGARIIFREPRPSFNGQYDQLPPSVRPQSMIEHNMITFNRSVLFTQEK